MDVDDNINTIYSTVQCGRSEGVGIVGMKPEKNKKPAGLFKLYSRSGLIITNRQSQFTETCEGG